MRSIYSIPDTPSPATRGSSENPRQAALLPGLVDIVENAGQRKFLKQDDVVKEEANWGGQLSVPAGTSSLPCAAPRLEEVRKYRCQLESGSLTSGNIFEALSGYLKRFALLPTENYYDLLAAWAFHT